MTIIIELLTALLEYLDLFEGFVQSAAVKALLLPQNASIIPDSNTYLFFRNYADTIASSLNEYSYMNFYY